MTYPIFCNNADVWLNSLPLNTIDETGCKWIVTDIDGWWELPTAEIPEDSRPFTEDGDYYTAGRYSARELTLTGVIVPSREKFVGKSFTTQARDAFNRLLMTMVRGAGVLRVEEPDAAKICVVQVVGRPLTKFSALNDVLEFEVVLRAADPRKYSYESYAPSTTLPGPQFGRTYNRMYRYFYGGSSSTGRITANNEGNYTTYGVLRITGPITDPTIENIEENRTLRFNIDLTQGDYLDVDLHNRTVVLNGTASRRGTLLPSSEWFDLPPGLSTLRFNGTQTVAPRPQTPARTNLATNPRPIATATNWSFVTGTSETTSATAINTAALAGPNASAGFVERTVTAQKTAGMSGWRYTQSMSGIGGGSYTASMWVRFSAPAQVVGTLTFLSGATTVNSVSSSTVQVPANTWVRVAASGVAEGSFNSVRFNALAMASNIIPVGGTYAGSSVVIETGSDLWPYFDGDSEFATWNGTAHNSTSSIIALNEIDEAMLYLTYRSAWIE